MMREAFGRSGEAWPERDNARVVARSGCALVVIKVELKDALDARHVEELEGEGALTRAINARPAVLVAEPEEALRLAKLRPREGAGEERGREAADVDALLLRLLDETRGITERVCGQLRWIIGVIGGAAGRGLRRMGLDQLTRGIDAHERAVAAHPDALANEARRHGVERLAEADVMIGMNAALRPARRIEALAGERQQRGPFALLEDGERALTRGAVDAAPSRLARPSTHSRLHLREIAAA